MERGLEWRRNKVLELSSQAHSQPEIATILQVGLGTVNRDLSYLRKRAIDNIRKYIDERLPQEYERCFVGLNSIVKEAWNTSQKAEDRREKIQALSLAKECYGMKLELLTNATVVDDAIRFLSGHDKPTTNISSETGTAAAANKSKTNRTQIWQELVYLHCHVILSQKEIESLLVRRTKAYPLTQDLLTPKQRL
jgi:hypothetical protein